MLSNRLKEVIKNYPDFPKNGILFKDVTPVFKNPNLFSELILQMSKWEPIQKCDGIVAIDARGFIFGSCIAFQASKPLLVARKPGKLPGELIENSYALEYGTNSLSMQEESLKDLKTFVIIDDLLATGGTLGSVAKILISNGKIILGAAAVIELKELFDRNLFDFPIQSQVVF